MDDRRLSRATWIAALLAALNVSASAETAVALPPGTYELRIETVLPHLEEALRYATERKRQCLHEPDATSVFPLLMHQAFTGCKLGPAAQSADGLHFTLHCDNPQAASGTAAFQVDAGAVAGMLDIKMGAKNMTVSQRVYGRRVGACPDAATR
jgi:hypothetical protein